MVSFSGFDKLLVLGLVVVLGVVFVTAAVNVDTARPYHQFSQVAVGVESVVDNNVLLAKYGGTGVVSCSDGNLLKWSSALNSWTCGSVTVTASGLPACASGQVLKYDGSNWTCGTDLTGGAGSSTIYLWKVLADKVPYGTATSVPANTCAGPLLVDISMDAFRLDGGGDALASKIFSMSIDGVSNPANSLEFGSTKGGSNGHYWGYKAAGLSKTFSVSDYSVNHSFVGAVTGSTLVTVTNAVYSIYCLGSSGGAGPVGPSGVNKIIAGSGVSVSPSSGTGDVTVSNTGVTSVAAGAGISVSASTGGVTISNTSMSQSTATTFCNTIDTAAAGRTGVLSLVKNGRNICEDDDGCSYRIWRYDTRSGSNYRPAGSRFYTSYPVMFRQKAVSGAHYWHDAYGDNVGVNGDGTDKRFLDWDQGIALWDDYGFSESGYNAVYYVQTQNSWDAPVYFIISVCDY